MMMQYIMALYYGDPCVRGGSIIWVGWLLLLCLGVVVGCVCWGCEAISR